MWKLFIMLNFLWTFSIQSELFELLSTTDELFEELSKTENFNIESEAVKLMVKRTYNLEEDHKISKRSLNDPLIHDKYGVYLLTNISDIAKIPVKFPNDINIFPSHNLLYISALEANGTNAENQLANDLVLFQYSSIQGIKEMGRVPVLGGVKIAVHTFRNTTFLLSAEHYAEKNPELYQGSTVYKMVDRGGRLFLEKVQILNVVEPNDVKFWEHQDQLYLAVGTNMGNDSLRTGTLIYRWLGFHFDCLQVIPSKNVKSVMPFTIGSFMYLAVSNFQDEYGNLDIDSEVFRFHLQEMKFKSFQKIRTRGAHDFSYFKFEDLQTKESEHFLIVANSLGKNSDGSLSSLKESVVYKFSKDYFIPFQSFKLHGATQWLPIRGSDGEFLLLVSCINGVVGYQYDGWRFTPINLHFGQTSFGNDIRSMRAFQYFGDIFLTIADKDSYANNVNLWKLSFSNRNELEKRYKEVETWCNDMNMKLTQDDFAQVVEKFKSILSEVEKDSVTKLKADSLIAQDVSQEIRDELVHLNEKAEALEKRLQEAEGEVENLKSNSELPIVIGSGEIPSLEVKCNTKDCCAFKKLKISKLNGKNFTEFLSDVVSLNDNITEPVLEFEHVVLQDNLSSPMMNGHPSETLIDVSSDTFINAEIVVNGTIFINDNLIVNGLYDEVEPDENHLLLNQGIQNIEDPLLVNTLKVKNLKLSGVLNGEPIQDLQKKPKVELKNTYKEMNVNNIFVKGLVGGYNITEVFSEALKKTGDQEIEGDVQVTKLEANEIMVDSDEISNISVSTLINAYNERLCESDPSSFGDGNYLENERQNFRSGKSDYSDEPEQADDYIIIVEGLLKVRDISDETNSTSLLDIINNSYKLNESVIDANFQFSHVVADDFQTDAINGDPLSSWVLRSSNETQRVHGKKIFSNGIHIMDEVSVKRINEVDLEELEKDVLKLEEDQDVPAHLQFNTINCYEVRANYTNFGSDLFDSQNRLLMKDSVVADQLLVENLTIAGDIDSVSWEHVVEDSAFEKDIISGEKIIKGAIRVDNLNVSGHINDLLFEEFVALTSTDPNKILLDRNVTVDSPLNVDELHFEGLLDSALTPDFELEWLLTEETQIITGPIIFENVEMKSGSNLMNETVNNIHLGKLFARSLKVNEDTDIKNLFVTEKVRAKRIDVDGTLNGANFNESIVRSKDTAPQEFSGDWFFSKGLTVTGSFLVEGHLSGLNVSHLCNLDPSDKVNLIVGGSVKLKSEPKILSQVNGIDLSEKAKEIWMRNENTTLRGSQMRFGDVDFENRTSLGGFFNGKNLTQISKFYLSKTLNRVIVADFEFDELIIKKWCRMHRARVGGKVNGINLSHWARNVLVQDEEQVIREKLRFEIFETSNIELEGTVNGLDLSRDVLRLDVDEAVVEGEKTFQAINVLNLTLAEGRSLQGVDMDAWRENSVKTEGNFVIKGDLILKNAVFNGPFKVKGQVNDISFDSKHLLTTAGRKQVVRGVKHFDYLDRPDSGMKIKSFNISGEVDGVDLDKLIRNQAYSNQNLVFKQAKTLKKGLVADSMEVDGLFHGVNISGMCDDFYNPVDVNNRKEEFSNLLNQTETLIKVLKGRAFFFDYLELIQTLKPNFRAVVPTLDHEGHYMLAVFTPSAMRFMDWNDYSETFVNTDEGLILTENVTFVASDISKNGSFLYIETTKSAKIFDPHLLKEIESTDTSCVASFQLKPLNKSCIFIGRKWNSSRVLCNSFLMNDLQTYQRLESKGSVQVAVLNIEDDVYVAVINKEMVFDKIENTLSIYRFDPKLQHFQITHVLAEVNPVALSSISYKDNHYLVSAGGHLPESVHNSVLSIFKFNKRHKVFVRAQSIQVDTPVDVHFALLPSNELALYVLTSNPTKPLVMFLHKGIAGFVEETSGLSLYPGTNIYSFTDSKKRHFVVIGGFGRGQILKAGFKGGV